ncbi:MAG: E2/UBC family protein [Phycisphaerae bacterium]|nr:E2/UBC family protein [Phycisphaerae bacterium]
MARPSATLLRHLQILSVAYSLTISDDYRWVIVHDFLVPPGYNWSYIDVLVEIPWDYPCSPLGVGGSHVFVPPDLRYRGRTLRDLHPEITPGWGRWAWFCYERVAWDPYRDNLVTFLETVRADLTYPPTK